MNLIQVQNGYKAYGARSLFAGATFAVNEGEHVGVIGPNGAGKTTLFRILTDEEELDRGEIIRSRQLKIGYLAQEVEWGSEETLEDYLSTCSKPIWDLKALGIDLGLDEGKFRVPINTLSGGYRMRCKLLYLIGCEPNLMMLDEPTNYLDLETLLVLERFLQNYQGAFLVISHDREFLRRITDHTLEIEEQQVTKYPGNIDDYFEEKALLREQLEKQALSQDAKKKQIMDFVNRFGAKATKARQAQSKLKSLNKLEKIEIRPLPVTAKITIPEPSRIGKKAVQVRNVDLGYDGKVILNKVDLTLVRGDKIGVVGYNGVGKSTLLKALALSLKPMCGEVDYGMDVKVGYYAQHVTEELDFEATILEELELAAHRDVTRQQVLDLAGSLLFSGDAVDKHISKLSGGEKARVALGKILLARVPVLVLDEVTNHLDFNTVEALTQALKKYQGTLITVSHDRGFISRVAKKILEIRDGRVLQYAGSYDEYVWSLERGALSEVEPTNEIQSSSSTSEKKIKRSGNYKEVRKTLERKVRDLNKESSRLEKQISTIQTKMDSLNEKLSQDPESRDNVLGELGSLPHQIMELEEAWTKVLEDRDKAEADLKAHVSQ